MQLDALNAAAAEAAESLYAAEPDPVFLYAGGWLNYAEPGLAHRLLMIASSGRLAEFEGEIRRARRGAMLRMELGLRVISGQDENHEAFCYLPRCVRNVRLDRCRCAEDAIGELGDGAAVKVVRARAEVLHARFARRLERARVRDRRDRPSRIAQRSWMAREAPPGWPEVVALVVEERVEVAPPAAPKPAADVLATSTAPARSRVRLSTTADLMEKRF